MPMCICEHPQMFMLILPFRIFQREFNVEIVRVVLDFLSDTPIRYNIRI